MRAQLLAFLHFVCETHFDSGTHGKVYDLGSVKHDISGMIQNTLALNQFGQIMIFRDAARKTVAAMLRVVDVLVLDDDAKAYTKLVMDTFVPDDVPSRVIRDALTRLIPGDWRIPGVFTWRRMRNETDEEIVDVLCEGLVPLFYGRPPYEFPRNRFTGARKTFKDIGLPSNINNFHYEVFKQHRRDIGEPDVFHEHDPGGDALLAIRDDDVLAAGAGVDGGGPGGAGDNAPPGAGAGGRAGLDAEIAAAGKANKAHRTQALRWLQTSPGCRLI